MGQQQQLAATGRGSISLGGAQPVTEFAAVTQARGYYSRQDGVEPVIRQHQVGWVGLVETDPVHGWDFVVWQTYISMEYLDLPVIFAAGNNPDTMYWDITSGSSVDIYVYW